MNLLRMVISQHMVGTEYDLFGAVLISPCTTSITSTTSGQVQEVPVAPVALYLIEGMWYQTAKDNKTSRRNTSVNHYERSFPRSTVFYHSDVSLKAKVTSRLHCMDHMDHMDHEDKKE